MRKDRLKTNYYVYKTKTQKAFWLAEIRNSNGKPNGRNHFTRYCCTNFCIHQSIKELSKFLYFFILKKLDWP